MTRPFFVALLIQKLNSKPAFAYWVAIFFQIFFGFFLDIFWGLKNGSYWWYLKNRKSDLSMSAVFFVAPLILNLNSKPAFAYRVRIFFQNFFWIFLDFFSDFFKLYMAAILKMAAIRHVLNVMLHRLVIVCVSTKYQTCRNFFVFNLIFFKF